jgi:hypothetical protein
VIEEPYLASFSHVQIKKIEEIMRSLLFWSLYIEN